MSRIRRLDAVVANQIAAGEVVERPASVVKELVENSLDAGATQIQIRIEQGGQSLIEVRDNGQGIEPEDLALALERHATSKLSVLADLDESPWLGFRGEALAAIAAVSRLTLSSRPRQQSVGQLVPAQGGIVGEQDVVAMAPGTVVRIQELFFNTPARLKSLKSPGAETGHIQHLVEHLAISRPDVGFRLVTEDRTLVKTPGQATAYETIHLLYGREVGETLIPVDYTGMTGIHITGWIGPAHVHRASRQSQGLYVNGRWVTNWVLRQAVEEAFKPQVPDRRFPLFWIWMELPKPSVDPNAHPTKAEVRIDHERQVAALLFRAVHDALVAKSSAPLLPMAGESARETGSAYDQEEWPLLPSTESRTEDGGVLHQEFLELSPLAQWQAKYIIAQGPLGLYLIDQHAAHERRYFEEFNRQKSKILVSQPLLVPYTLTLNAAQWDVFQRFPNIFESVGFEIGQAGGSTVIVRAVPQGLRDMPSDPAMFRMILDSLIQGQAHPGHPITWIEEPLCAMAACKAAIKAYRPMSQHEMVTLLHEMAYLEDPRGCPHGRPTLIRLSLEEVDRRFGRKG